jgi:hypothetical protein
VDLLFVSLPATPPAINLTQLSGGSFIASGTNGIPNWPYYVLAATNLAQPLADWPRVATNQFDANGGFAFTNDIYAAGSQRFFTVQIP